MTTKIQRFLAAALLACCAQFDATAADFAARPEAVTPVLLGTTLPGSAAVRRIDGSPATLTQVVGGKPAVLIFYRGGWCPFCNLQLSQLRLVEKDIRDLGYQIVAISPDRPEELKKTLQDDALDYTLVSDANSEAMRAFGVAYKLDDDTVANYKTHGVDLEKYAGGSAHTLPVASVFVFDAAGVLQFSYVHPDYRVRAPAEVVLAAARAIAANKHKLQPAH